MCIKNLNNIYKSIIDANKQMATNRQSRSSFNSLVQNFDSQR